MTLIFENSAWKIFKNKNGRRLVIKSKSGLGVAYATITGREYSYSGLDLNGRRGRIIYINGDRIPVYMKAKVTSYFRHIGRIWR